MAQGRLASHRLRALAGVGLAHAALLWVLAHERLHLERRSESALSVLFLAPARPPQVPRAAHPPRPPSAADGAVAPLRLAAPPTAAVSPAPAVPATAPLSLAATGAQVASGFGAGRAAAEAVRGFGFPAAAPKARPPPTIFEEPSPRIGRTDRTAEGEQILWLTKNCYASLGSDSLILKDVHAFHRKLGRICEFGLPPPPRGDLFAPLKRPDPLAPDAAPPATGR